MRGYDRWKTTNPDDKYLGPEPSNDDPEPVRKPFDYYHGQRPPWPCLRNIIKPSQ